VAALSTAVYGRPRDGAHVAWKLFDTAVSPGVAPSFVAVSEREVVGHYAGSPMRFSVRGEMRTGLHGCDVMTASAMRRQGVLTELGTAAHDAWRAAGLAFVTGLANESWGTRSAVLGWNHLFTLRWLLAPLRPEVLLARRVGIPGLSRARWLGALVRSAAVGRRAPRGEALTVDELTSAGPELDELWEACRFEHELGAVRDQRFVDWRYFRAPNGGYRVLLARRGGRPAGFVAFSPRGGTAGHAVVADLFSARDDAAVRTALLVRALDELTAGGAESVRALALPGTPFWRSFRRAGFLPRGPYTFEVVPLDSSIPIPFLADPRRWLLAGGDFDVV
jgi:Acetyltransferase (GNAT) domain